MKIDRLSRLNDRLREDLSSALYRVAPKLPEGRMTRLRAELVCEQSLWEVSEALELGRVLRLGKGEELTGGRTRPSILADCVEAVIAALYLDGGFEPAKALIDRFILSRLGADGALATPAEIALVVMAIGAGAMTVSHANDSYFWVVTNFGDMTPEQGYKTQTLMTLIIGIAAMVEIFLLSLVF